MQSLTTMVPRDLLLLSDGTVLGESGAGAALFARSSEKEKAIRAVQTQRTRPDRILDSNRLRLIKNVKNSRCEV
jgi:hypothetical protein